MCWRRERPSVQIFLFVALCFLITRTKVGHSSDSLCELADHTTHRWLEWGPRGVMERREHRERRDIGSDRRAPEDVVEVADGRLADGGCDWDYGLGSMSILLGWMSSEEGTYRST